MTRPVDARTPGGRPRRRGPVLAAIAGVAALLLAGSIIALRFHGSPQAPGPAAGSATASPPARHAATATTPAAAPSRSSSAPASATAPPASSPSASRAATPKASATVSSPAASGPAMVPIPDVIGMDFAKARLVLIDDGFKVVGRHARLGPVVTGTSPSGQAPAGSVIIVVYGTGL
jgi:hypothetical protein